MSRLTMQTIRTGDFEEFDLTPTEDELAALSVKEELDRIVNSQAGF